MAARCCQSSCDKWLVSSGRREEMWQQTLGLDGRAAGKLREGIYYGWKGSLVDTVSPMYDRSIHQ